MAVFPPLSSRVARDTPAQAYWGYEDIAIFLVLIAVYGAAIRLLNSSHFLPDWYLTRPPLYFQFLLPVAVAGTLCVILRLRYRALLLGPLGWTLASAKYLALSLLAGAAMAFALTVPLHYWKQPTPLAPHIGSLPDVLLWVLLGPVVEETVFRGFLLPVISRSMRAVGAVVITAVFFALLHQPASQLHWAWFTLCGVAYGGIRVASGSTLAAAIMHASYNLTILLAPFAYR